MFPSLLSAAIGVCVALVLAIPAFVVEWRHRKHGDHPFLVDIDFWRGKKLTDRESFLLGLLIHLCLGLFFGLAYPFYGQLVEVAWGWWPNPLSFSWLSLLYFVIDLFFLQNIIVLPFLGAGLFGRKEARFIWLETLITLLLFAFLYGAVVHWFGGGWFQSYSFLDSLIP